MKKLLLLLALFVAKSIFAQTDSPTFVPPFSFPLFLSGGFAELRNNHFHGGVDFKTESVIRKPVASIADGYISRVSIAPSGYGKALYVTHTNGYTSVYGHLDGFLSNFKKWVEAYQYGHETFELDVELDSLLFPVKGGQQIAWSGNTGHSFGPHLHMEIRKTATNERIDPLQFYTHLIADTRPPRAQSILISPMRGEGSVNQSAQKQTFEISSSTNSNSNCISKTVEAWGKIGIGIKALDYMNDTENNFGVQSVTLLVDGKQVFKSVLSHYTPDEDRLINSFTDFEYWRGKSSWYMKSYLDQGNFMRALKTDQHRGVISITEERLYHLVYLLTDLYGNQSSYSFDIQGKRGDIESIQHAKDRTFYVDQNNQFFERGIELYLPKGMLYETLYLDYSTQKDSSCYSSIHRLHSKPVPLHASCDLFLGVKKDVIQNKKNYYVALVNGKSKRYVGGKYENGWMKCTIRELGSYAVCVDNTKPKIVPVKKEKWTKNQQIVFSISDGQTGIKTFKGTIDGKFALFTFDAKSGQACYQIDTNRIKKGAVHALKFTVTDQCENRGHYEGSFNF